jgi:hypothetical protein
VTHQREDLAMQRAFLIIAVAVTLFGVAAVSMARHSHHLHKAGAAVDL